MPADLAAESSDDMCSAWGCGGIWNRSISETIPLCTYHFAEASAAYLNSIDRAERAMDQAGVALEERMVAVHQHESGRPVVYYVAMGDHIKIGTTAHFTRRMRSLYVRPENVLAVEARRPGARRFSPSTPG